MPGIGDNIRTFARNRRGQQVGNGECWTLVETALRNAGARTSNDIMGADNVTEDADYVWGEEVNAADARPGDIVQFRDYRYDLSSETSTEWQERPHHTAIIDTINSDGTIQVFESNVGGSRRVQRNRLFLRSGSVGNSSVTVTGRIWVYRPQAK
ncbi:CHAP domain-containing protein [Spirosoma montaniterrae]|uniref:BBC1/AIM3 cysteine proteinase-fold domain-containing protein n=1 Tax=Spirosoma montaniterrae TaxID=1178516 RepID=A0A1P9WYS8_9BACT|nr:CHAP domain-containing protein [Spirosoma montaniterrae]AQG80532.1 hypothetical protein AWR27_15100 [Spirosoma montaniterrae]